MFKKIFFRKGRFLNSLTIVLSLALIVLATIQTITPISKENPTSLFAKIPVLFGIPVLILASLGLITVILIIVLEHKKGENSKLFIIKKSINYLLTILLSFYFIEYVILGTIHNFQIAESYNKMPEKDLFFVSVAWVVQNYGKDYLRGILATLSISLIGTVIGLVFGLFVAILRVQKVEKNDSEFTSFLKKIALGFSKGYIGLFRGTPMMVQAILLYYLIPFAISQATGISMTIMDKIFTAFVSGLITVTLNTTAYLAEVLRGSIENLDKGQSEAARSLGFGYWKTMFYVVLPQALKNSMASIGNEFVINIKDTSVLNVITVVDIFFVANEVQSDTFRFSEPFFIAAIIYLILTFVTTRILSLIDKKMDVESKPLPSCN